MNMSLYNILFIIGVFTVFFDCNAFSFSQKIKSFMHRNIVEKIDQKEIPAKLIESLSLSNINGSITIKTGPKKSLFLRTIQKIAKASINNINVEIETLNHSHLSIITKNTTKKHSGSIDYELIVPEYINIALTINGSGDVFIKDVQGMINVATHDNITIINTKNIISTQTLKKGNITIIDAHGPVEAYTYKGTITAQNVAHNFDGRSIKGKVNISYNDVPQASSINLATHSGNITLALPAQTNADIYGKTIHGTCMSDHEIMLKSYTTKLNKSAWSDFTRQINGTLGTGDASIHLTSSSGNIRIIETKIS